MACFSANHFSLLFIFIAFLFSAPQVKARESRFFSKVIRRDKAVDNNLKVTEIFLAKTPAPAPAAATAPAPVPAPSADPETTEYSYGLYGSEEGSASSTQQYIPSATDVVDGESTLTEEQLVVGDEGRFETRYDRSNGNNNNNNYYYHNGNYRKNGQQGMSDTRFLDNGRYYPDFKSDETNNINENENQNESVGNNNYYYNGFGINSHESAESERYVFDSMEEYEKYQESHGHLP